MSAILDGTPFDCIYFSHTPEELGISEGCRADIAFSPQINEFGGKISVQLIISALKLHDGSEFCSEILEPSACSCKDYAAAFTPDRQVFAKAWHTVSRSGFRVGSDVHEMVAQSPAGMPPEQFCICLLAFYQAGLLRIPVQKAFSVPKPSIRAKKSTLTARKS